MAVYKELYAHTPRGWVPDGLEKIALPYFLILPEPQSALSGQTTQSFWLDLWVPRETPVGRLRVQAVLKSGERWLQYPMEVRVMEAVAPNLPEAPRHVAPLAARADASLIGPLEHALCGKRANGPAAPLTVREFIRRNAGRDLELLRLSGNGAAHRYLLQSLGENWCGSGVLPAALANEWYLRFRDLLYRRARP